MTLFRVNDGEKSMSVLSAQTLVNGKKDKKIMAVLSVNCGSLRNHEDDGKRKRENVLK